MQNSGAAGQVIQPVFHSGPSSDKKIARCQTVTAELELSPLSFHSLPFQRADVSPPRPRNSAAKTAHLLSIWPSSISGLATRDTMINILPPALSFLIVPRALSIFHRRDGGRGQIDESRHQSIRDPTHLSS